ncbi:hypothetical protein ABH968_000653 [Lysinibacillus sp. RC79]
MDDLRNVVLIIAGIIASIKGSLDIIDWMKRKDENDNEK